MCQWEERGAIKPQVQVDRRCREDVHTLPDMANWIINNGFPAVMVVVWMTLNTFLFVWYYLYYDQDESFYYTRHLLGSALAWARAPAAVLNFNCMLILLPVCRNLLSLIRGSFVCCSRTMRKQLDQNLTFHKLVAYMIALMTAVHTVAHLLNLEWLNNSKLGLYDELSTALSRLEDERNETFLNPLQHIDADPQQIPTHFAFTSIAGPHGGPHHSVSHLDHHLLYGGDQAELLRGVLVHPPPLHRLLHRPRLSWIRTWKWVIGPMIIYVCERVLRFIRYMQAVQYRKVRELSLMSVLPREEFLSPGHLCFQIVMHPSKVLELQLRKKGFKMEVGQYVFLNCPSISQLEWHPFTMTSAPEEDFFSVHIRSAGDWTDKLIDVMQKLPEGEQGPKMGVDGPFGTASEDVFDYEVSMLVGAGIGVTPFASIMKSIWYKFKESDPKLRTRKIYFYWLCRETHAFEWFADLLQVLEKEMEERGLGDFLTYKLFLTGWDQGHTNQVIVHFDEDTDVVTGLKQKTHYGRPNWDKEFDQVRKENPASVVGTFLCGPAALAKVLEKKCAKYSDVDPRKTKFYFNKENF
ncbi:Cytochrome b-245 heavy chain [Oryzias melastigma]|uniref:Cytochrome b-245 heavy chain n=1 Tax=Oryzias melastigma TaxID=30732 RepID=A0A834CU34_ORYME|nr:Cytochrome b-245 heavy chain [Oryzias melastigma]